MTSIWVNSDSELSELLERLINTGCDEVSIAESDGDFILAVCDDGMKWNVLEPSTSGRYKPTDRVSSRPIAFPATVSFSSNIRLLGIPFFDQLGYPLSPDAALEAQARDRIQLIHILWRSAMPGWAPITPEHPDWPAYISEAERIIEGRPAT